jgi:mannan endo-1,4-beta-mannosidase
MSYLPPADQDEAHVVLQPRPGHRRRGSRKQAGGGTRRRRRIITPGVAVIALAAIAAGVILYNRSAETTGPLPVDLPPSTASYLGVYTKGIPSSYDEVAAFTNAIGTRPDVVMFYSGWYVPFPAGFATTAADNGAVPLIQMDPDSISLARIASGQYDGYLSEYAEAVRLYRHPVILSFAHEMNGNWYSWGYQRTPAKEFVAAWRHIVTLFRVLGARNVTWLWTVNIVDYTQAGAIPDPAPWWPGSSYVTWVGIDGYYLEPSWQFAPLFGPTIRAVRALTGDPILIAETGATPAADQPAKINDLFAGVRAYGLLGFVWFNATNERGLAFGISSPAAVAAFRKGASTFTRPAS